jgi:hypothetical protein
MNSTRTDQDLGHQNFLAAFVTRIIAAMVVICLIKISLTLGPQYSRPMAALMSSMEFLVRDVSTGIHYVFIGASKVLPGINVDVQGFNFDELYRVSTSSRTLELTTGITAKDFEPHFQAALSADAAALAVDVSPLSTELLAQLRSFGIISKIPIVIPLSTSNRPEPSRHGEPFDRRSCISTNPGVMLSAESMTVLTRTGVFSDSRYDNTVIPMRISHGQFRTIGDGDIVRGLCLFENFRANYLADIQVLLPSLPLVSYALAHQRKLRSSLAANQKRLPSADNSMAFLACLALHFSQPAVLDAQIQAKKFKDELDNADKKCREESRFNSPYATPELLARPISMNTLSHAFPDKRKSASSSIKDLLRLNTVQAAQGTAFLTKGGVLFFGRSDSFSNDFHELPFGATLPGVDIHLAATKALDQGNSVQRVMNPKNGKSHWWVAQLLVPVVIALFLSLAGAARESVSFKNKISTQSAALGWTLNTVIGGLIGWLITIAIAALIILTAFSFFGIQMAALIDPYDKEAASTAAIVIVSIWIEIIIFTANLIHSLSNRYSRQLVSKAIASIEWLSKKISGKH